MKKATKFLSVLLAVLMIIMVMPFSSFADTIVGEMVGGDTTGDVVIDDTTSDGDDSSVPEGVTSLADVVALINKATAKAAKASYIWSRDCYYTKPIDLGLMTGTLNSIIQAVDPNANIESVVGGFLGVGSRTAEVADGQMPEEMGNFDYLLKAMNLTKDDVKQFRAEGNKYMLQLNDCTNPQKDGTNALHHVTNDFVTVDEVNGGIADAGVGNTLTVQDSSQLNYKNIVIIATITNGYLRELEINYIFDVSLNLKISFMSTTGTGALRNEITYSDFVYENEPDVVLGDVNGDGKLSAIDARWALQYSAGNKEFTDDQIAAADVNGDGKISAIDARWILQASAGNRVL